MRVLLGLACLASLASVQGAVDIIVSNAFTPAYYFGGSSSANPGYSTVAPGSAPNNPATGGGPGPSRIDVTTGAPFGNGLGAGTGVNQVQSKAGAAVYANPSALNLVASGTGVNNGGTVLAGYTNDQTLYITNTNYAFTLAAGTTTVYLQMNFNSFVTQVVYSLSASSFNVGNTCDPCLSACDNINTSPNLPGSKTGTTYPTNCAELVGRIYQIGSNANPLVLNPANTRFQVSFADFETNSNSVAYSLAFTFKVPPIQIVGDPQIIGMQGQDFQVHGMPDEIFNMITYPNVQVNARFSYLSEAECPDNYTACFAHPGTYISEQGIRVGKDKVRVVAGSAKKGLTVHVNGKKVHERKTHLNLGSVEVINHRRVVVKTPIAALTMTNSDKFMNQEIALFDEKLLSLGSERRILKDSQSFHPEVPLHGLQGQTWRNVEYPSGLEYEGSIMDYHVVDGNLFGTDFVFNKYKL